jgi:hypothetical protein
MNLAARVDKLYPKTCVSFVDKVAETLVGVFETQEKRSKYKIN